MKKWTLCPIMSDRCSMLNLNPIIVAKHFQYRVETFFRDVLLTNANPVGKIVYYALCIEFQMRGSPHLHALIWTSDCPHFTDYTKDAYIDYAVLSGYITTLKNNQKLDVSSEGPSSRISSRDRGKCMGFYTN